MKTWAQRVSLIHKPGGKPVSNSNDNNQMPVWKRWGAPLQSAFKQGTKAFRYGTLDSPYPENSDEDKEWRRGFNSAFHRNQIYWEKRRING